MDILQGSLQTLCAGVTGTTVKSNQFKKTFKHANIKCSDAEREDILARAADTFSSDLDKRINSLLEETDIAARLDDLKDLIDSCNELNEKSELDTGYRPVNPHVDVSGHLYNVQTSYDNGLQIIRDGVEDELENQKAELFEKLESIQELEKQIRHYLKK